MIKHLMKDPEDLDPFSDEQAELTRVLDSKGAASTVKLVMFAASIQSSVDDVLLRSGCSPVEWQRAAHEAHQMSKSEPTAANRIISRGLWSIVRYMQEGVALAREGAADPEMQAHFKRLNLPIPKDED